MGKGVFDRYLEDYRKAKADYESASKVYFNERTSDIAADFDHHLLISKTFEDAELAYISQCKSLSMVVDRYADRISISDPE